MTVGAAPPQVKTSPPIGIGARSASAAPAVPAGAAAAPGMGFTIGSLGTRNDGSPVERIIADLDDVAALGGNWVRLDVPARHLLTSWHGENDRLDFDALGVADMHAVLDAAAGRGLQVCLMYVNHYDVPDEDDDYWLRRTTEWWEAISERFAAKAQMFQIFNEADGAHYRQYGSVGEPPRADYLEELASRVATARDIIRRHNPQALVTTNLYGWPVGDHIEQRWIHVLDVLAEAQDIITVDAYVDWDDEGADTLNRLVERTRRLTDRYGKPVAIGEFGVSTCSSCASEQEQAGRLTRAVALLRPEESDLLTTFLYQLRDRSERDEHEETFGVMTADGTPKQAYSALQEIGLR